MYTQQDILELETLTNAELKEVLVEAQEKIDYLQSLYSENSEKVNPKIKLEVIFMHLKNIEFYIRRIENLLYEYESERVIVKRAIQRRNKRFTRL